MMKSFSERVYKSLLNVPAPAVGSSMRAFAAPAHGTLRFSRTSEIFGADLRSLAALRVVLAIIVLVDLAGRAANLRVHYSDDGVLSRQVLLGELNPWRWSLNLLNGTVGFQLLLFGIAITAALGMLVGYRTRLMTIIVWALILSIQVRNPMVLSSGDSLLRLLLFWSMFLPLGAWWSVDRRRRAADRYRSMQFFSVATVGIFLQIAFMYWFTALLKSGDEWRSSGTALYYALGAQHLTRELGEYLAQFEALLQMFTFATLGLEVIAPVLLFSPILFGPVRTVAVGSIMLLHLGILLTLDLGIFPWTSALCMVCFLPAWFWDKVGPMARTLMCRLDSARGFGGAASVATAFRTAYQDRMKQLVPVGFLAPVSTGDVLEHGQKGRVTPTERRIGPGVPVTLGTSRIVNLFAALCLVLVFGWNMASVSDFTMPGASRPAVYSLGLHQRWSMFAPRPIGATIWYVYQGTLADGTQLDLLPTIVQDDVTLIRDISWDEPRDISGELYGDKYWRKYLDSVAASGYFDERQALFQYTCRTWNEHYGGDVALDTIDLIKMRRSTLPDYQDAPVETQVIGAHRCT